MTGCFILCCIDDGLDDRLEEIMADEEPPITWGGQFVAWVCLIFLVFSLERSTMSLWMLVFVYKVDGKVCKTCIITSYAGYFHVSRHCVFTFLDDICFIDIVTWISNECLARLGTVYSHGISPKMSYVTTVVLGNIHLVPIPLKYPQ